MDIQENKTYTYFNWTLTWPINQVFDQIINCDVTRPSYSKKKRPSHFALNKRKWYKKLSVWVGDFWVSDIKVIPGSSCWWIDDKTFIYMLSPSRTEYEIWLWPNNCEFEATKITEWDACSCWYNQFTEVEYAIWTPKIVSGNVFADWVQSSVVVTNYDFGVTGGPVQWRLSVNDWTLRTINYGTWSTQVNIWDYVVIRTGRASWQGKRVTGYDVARKELILDTPWSWFESGTLTYTWWTASIYPKWWTTLLYADATWPRVLNVDVISTTETIQTISLNIIENKCIADITVSSWIWNFMTSEWFVVFGNAWLDVAYFAGSELVWEQFNQMIAFRWYNVFTSPRLIKAWIVTAVSNAYNQNLYDLSTDIGMWSVNAYAQFKNSLYILWSNKRLYAASIVWSGSTNIDPKLELQNMSEAIVWELDLLEPGDSVTLSADEKQLKIFINRSWKTKVLIYESDYWFWHTHLISNWSITKYSEWYYIWDWLYRYCGITDWPITDAKFYEQVISATLGENEPNWMSLNSFQDKKLDFIKSWVWPSILNEWSSRMDIEVNRWSHKSTTSFDQWNKIERVKHYNDIFAWVPTEPSECITYWLTSCETIENQFDWSINKDETFWWQSSLVKSNQCQCSQEFNEKSDFVDWYDSKAYYLSDYYNIFTSTQELKQATLFKIIYVIGWWDRLRFNWFFAWVLPGAIEDFNWDMEDVLQSSCSIC